MKNQTFMITEQMWTQFCLQPGRSVLEKTEEGVVSPTPRALGGKRQRRGAA